jgi:hypothetical protein
MSCATHTTCLPLYVGPCAETIDLGLKADLEGTWRVLWEFNGVWRQVNLTLAVNAAIIIPNDLNPSYSSKIQIFRPDNTLFEDTQFIANIHYVLNADSAGPVPEQTFTVTTNITFKVVDNPADTGDGSYENPYQVAPGETITVPQVIGKVVHEPQTINFAPEYMSYDTATGIFQRAGGNLFYEGDIITISYEA